MLKYKIALVLNRTDEQPNLRKYLDWFASNTPIEIEWIDTIHTDFDVTYKKIGNAVFNGIICDNNIVPKLRTVIPEGKYNAVVFYWGNPITDIRVSSVNGGDGSGYLYPDTEVIQLATISDNGKTLNHELFHAFFMKARKLQANITDNIDTYWNDSNLIVDGVIDTNREVALKSLAPYWPQICAFRNVVTQPALPIVTITRKVSTSKEIIGELRSNDGMFGCDSLELPWLNNKRNISCIPAGEYICKWNRTLKYPLGGYEIQNVPNRSGIRIHKGNYFFNIQGCILLGSLPKDINGDKEVDLQNSTLIVDAFVRFMGKKDFTLIIK